MAASGKTSKTANNYNGMAKPVFWASTGMSDKQETVVPGVNTVGNMRPRVKGGKTKEIRAYIPVKQPIVETTDSQGTKTSFGITSDLSTVDTDISNLKSKQVSLRDLCVEDKKRVANLIKELARVVEEKENAEHNLASERNHYQEQILKLVEQQEAVLKEREDVQNKLLDYQSLIVKLQQEQQLHHLKRQQERHRKLQQKSPAKEPKVDVPVSSVPVKEVKSQRSSQSARKVASHRSVAQEDVPQPMSQPKPEAQADFDESCKTSNEEDDNESPVELPSQNLYMNMLEDSGVEDFSTRAHPAVSSPRGNEHPKALSYRPFTTMIDRELAKQHAALTSMDHMFEDYNALQRREERRAKETKSPLRTSANTANGTCHDSQEKGNRNHNIEATAANPEFVLASHPFVSPEKAEIFSRFMHSQSKDGQHHRNEDLKWSEKGLRVDEHKRSLDLTGPRKQRKKKRPPATYGVLHPPIMSSTQKSSEIGDYVNSTINSDRKVAAVKEDRWHNVNKGKDEESDEGSEDVDGHKLIGRHEIGNVDVEGNTGDRAGSMNRMKKSKHKAKPKVEFSDQLATNKDFQAKNLEADNLLGVDPDYLSYYKNLSGTERKRELLKQRTKLLEEQNKLRKILTDQENRLMLKQAEVVARKDAVQDVEEQDKIAMSKLQDSLEEMEFQVALKEEAIRKEKELLERRRKEQTERRSAGLKSMDTDAGHSQGRDNNFMTHQPEKARIDPRDKLDAGKEILNKALILADDEGVDPRYVATGGRNVPAETHLGVKENKHMVVTEKNDRQSKQPNGGQETESRTSAAKSASAVSNEQREDELARRLEYSFHSDVDQPISDRPLEVRPQAQTFPYKDAIKAEAVSATSNLASLEGKVDAGTSISFTHLGQNASGIRDGENIVGVERRAATETKHLTKSPGDKTMAVIEIINSLDDLDDLATSKVGSVPVKSLMVKGRQEASNRKTKVLRKKQPSKHTASTQGLLKQLAGVKMSKPGLIGHSAPFDDKSKQFSSLPFGPIKRQERFGRQHGLGFEVFPVGHVEDSELDFFHLPQFREERLEGCRRLANRDTDDDSDDVTYEYDDNDDSNLDDIVNALSRSFITNEEEEERGSRDEVNIWESVGSDSDDGYGLELEDNLHLDADCSSVEENLNFKSDGEKKKYADDNDILEEIFFVHP